MSVEKPGCPQDTENPIYNPADLNPEQIRFIEETIRYTPETELPQAIIGDLFRLSENPLYMSLAINEFPMFMRSIINTKTYPVNLTIEQQKTRRYTSRVMDNKQIDAVSSYLDKYLNSIFVYKLTSDKMNDRESLLLGEMENIFRYFTENPQHDGIFLVYMGNITYETWANSINENKRHEIEFKEKTGIDGNRFFNRVRDRTDNRRYRGDYLSDVLAFYRSNLQAQYHICNSWFAPDPIDRTEAVIRYNSFLEQKSQLAQRGIDINNPVRRPLKMHFILNSSYVDTTPYYRKWRKRKNKS
jgi:hypothetical protein